nr:MAG TPA: hypothetical protein [Bacteriophage sp.]
MGKYTTLEQVKIRLGQFHIETLENEDETSSDVTVFDHKEENPQLEILIEQAEQDVINKRSYPNTYTEDMIKDDLKKFQSVIVNLTVYDHSQAGEEFMQSYSENGVSRNWKSRDDLFVGVYPFVSAL